MSKFEFDDFTLRVYGDLFKAIEHRHRREIIEALINTDKESLTWEELRSITKLTPNTLHFHLKKLSMYAMTERWEYIGDLAEGKIVGHYQLTDLGKTFINSMLSMFYHEEKSESV